MSRSKFRLAPVVRDALDATGLPWEIVQGTKHFHIRVCGDLVGILPMGKMKTNSRQLKNLLSDIQKLGKEQHGTGHTSERRVGPDSHAR